MTNRQIKEMLLQQDGWFDDLLQALLNPDRTLSVRRRGLIVPEQSEDSARKIALSMVPASGTQLITEVA